MAKWTKNYVKGANGREIKFDNGGSIITVVIPKESLGDLDLVKSKSSGKEFYKFQIAAMQNPDQYGNTHSVFTSTPPEEEKVASGDNKEAPTAETSTGEEVPNDLPF